MTPLRTLLLFALCLMSARAAPRQSKPPSLPQTGEIPCVELRIKAYLWKPDGTGPFAAVLFNHGSGDIDPGHTAGMPITEAAAKLAPHFIDHGYAFLFLFRRGQGLSADQAPSMQDRLRREEVAHGREPRDQLQFQLLITEQLDDVIAALSFLKTVPGVDSHRISVMGHSFGGQLTLLAAERDSSLRAAVTFAAASASWDHSPQLRERLETAVCETPVPIMLTHASNDYSTSPGLALARERERQHLPVVLKIYPPVGQTADDGHNMVYGAIPQWESDVFKFLDEYVKR